MRKKRDSTYEKITRRIRAKGRGWVFTPIHLSDLGTRNAVASALKRLKAAASIRQLTRGLYDYPAQTPEYGLLAPSADAIARALTARDATRIQPAGDYAANQLGLSEQVPSRIVFITDGPDKKVRLGRREIILRHTTPRNMATAGRPSGTLIQALKQLGQRRVTPDIIARLRRQIAPPSLAAIRKDAVFAPAWIAAILRNFDAPALPSTRRIQQQKISKKSSRSKTPQRQ
ncbi:MAG: DUF6088 family protein [Puniceicoccales bacterium]|jgi:hypothetical protein|nr:DUF6088 family protein [Puniceicoccales bacterium]